MGDEPVRACNPKATEVTWNQTGPQGPKGDPGDAGLRGPRGRRGALGFSGTYTVQSPMLEVRGTTAQTSTISCTETADVMTSGGYQILDNGTTTEILASRPKMGR